MACQPAVGKKADFPGKPTREAIVREYNKTSESLDRDGLITITCLYQTGDERMDIIRAHHGDVSNSIGQCLDEDTGPFTC